MTAQENLARVIRQSVADEGYDPDWPESMAAAVVVFLTSDEAIDRAIEAVLELNGFTPESAGEEAVATGRVELRAAILAACGVES